MKTHSNGRYANERSCTFQDKSLCATLSAPSLRYSSRPIDSPLSHRQTSELQYVSISSANQSVHFNERFPGRRTKLMILVWTIDPVYNARYTCIPNTYKRQRIRPLFTIEACTTLTIKV